MQKENKEMRQKNFAKRPLLFTPPSLIAFQRNSFENFINNGIKESFQEVFPITDYSNKD